MNKIRSIISLIAVVVIFLPSLMLSSLPSEAATLEELEAQSERLKREADALNREIAKQEAKKTNEQAYLTSINSQIENVKQQIALLDKQISTLNSSINNLNNNIKQKEAAVAEKEKEIESQQKALGKRLRSISKSGNVSTLQMLLSTDDYTEYLVKSKVMERLSNSSQEMIDKLNEDITSLNLEKEELAKDKAEVSKQLDTVNKLKGEENSKKKELDTLYAKSNAAIKSLSSSISEIKDDVKAKNAEMEKTHRLILAKIKESQSNGNYSGGTMTWPVPAVQNISSGFGTRWGRLHKGIDISEGAVPVYGQNIVAAADGTVVTANTTNSWGGGYGYYITINHGTNSSGVVISTLYAHLSAVLVSSGQTVKAGTVIGRAGSTGNVTGPHLHFEVHENGVAVNPVAKGYIKKG